MKTEFSRQIFEKYTNMNFHENPSIVSLVVPCRLTDRWTDGRTAMKNLIVSFRDFANAPKNSSSNFGKKKLHEICVSDRCEYQNYGLLVYGIK